MHRCEPESTALEPVLGSSGGGSSGLYGVGVYLPRDAAADAGAPLRGRHEDPLPGRPDRQRRPDHEDRRGLQPVRELSGRQRELLGRSRGVPKNLTGSSFAKLLTQYTQSPASAYTLAGSSAVTYKTFTGVYFDNDLFTILHSAIAGGKLPTGFSHLYHIFLPKGSWTCFDGTRSCYSPGRNSTFDFCAYHAYVRFSDIGLVVYSVEPYQKVSGCASKASAGASALTNSTASTLGHETFESITDPGQKFAWFNFTFDEEVADLCETYEWNVTLGGTKYSIQPMYSNKYHACADGP